MNLSHLLKRSEERVESHFTENLTKSTQVVIIGSNSDVGVMRNGGRNGTRFAPESIVNFLKKMTRSKQNPLSVFYKNISNQKKEYNDFEEAQKDYQKALQQLLVYNPKYFFHLGGGHDHVYPLLMALGTQAKKIAVLNLDAHCDTRKDNLSHSGNPFRQFSENYEGEFKLIEFGIQQFSNSETTIEPLKKGTMTLIFKDDPNAMTKLNNIMSTLDESWILLFSLDCDGMDSSIMEAVSAPNPNGLTYTEVSEIMTNSIILSASKKYFGIYEYNPLYDSLSSRGARIVASLIYQQINI